MSSDWQELMMLTAGRDLVVRRVEIKGTGIAIEGEFELPAMAMLTAEDQVFVVAFVRSGGSITRMQQLYGVSYPTIKARLKRMADRLPMVEVKSSSPPESVLDRLERGEITASEAIEGLEQ